MPTKLDHCVIHVSDWERSNKFYSEVMGAELVARPKGFAYRFGDKQLNAHGPGIHPAEVARLPVQPGNSDLCFEWRGPIADAIAHLKKASRLAPKSSYVFTLLGEAYLGTGNNSAAADAFKKALQLDPDNTRARDGFNDAQSQVPPAQDD